MNRQRWVRYARENEIGFGTLEGDEIRVWRGEMFADPQPTDERRVLTEVALRMPVQPTKVLALWNNFRALGEKLNLAVPPEPLYVMKAPNGYLDPDGVILKPRGETKVVYEGELGIVIGKVCSGVSEAEALDRIFGYTCANDVTAAEILTRDASFGQWIRAKGFDTFCPLGPVVATGLDPATLVVQTRMDGELRQDYPVGDMRFSVEQLVSRISQDMTLYPGDVILCGTSIGVAAMQPGCTVEVSIEGIGTLSNRYEARPEFND